MMTPDTLTLIPYADIRRLVACWRGLIHSGLVTDQAGIGALIDQLANADGVALLTNHDHPQEIDCAG